MEATLQQHIKLCKNFVKNVNMYQNNGLKFCTHEQHTWAKPTSILA